MHSRHTAKLAAEAPARRTSRSTNAHLSAPRAAATEVAAAPPVSAPVSATQPTPPATPIANLKGTQAATAAQPPAHPRNHDNTVPIAAGGVLALLAIGGAAVAVNRRRNEDDEEWLSDDGSTEPAPVAHDVAESQGEVDEHDQPAILAPPVSAFQWKAGQSPAQGSEEPLAGTDDRDPGETWVERAYRGPSALNPSVSLKTRLKRAAFFDKRERDASAGLAEPVDPSAGLPERMIDENQLGQQSEFA